MDLDNKFRDDFLFHCGCESWCLARARQGLPRRVLRQYVSKKASQVNWWAFWFVLLAAFVIHSYFWTRVLDGYKYYYAPSVLDRA